MDTVGSFRDRKETSRLSIYQIKIKTFKYI